MKRLYWIAISFLFFSCSQQESIRVDLLQNDQKKVAFELEFGEEVNFYADIDIEYKEEPVLVYHCDLLFNGESLYNGGVDPLVTVQNVYDTTSVENGITHRKFYGRLRGNLRGREDGVYAVITTLVKNNHPDLKINKADIVFVK